ncbi:hypothetical protein LRP49_03715 [Enterovibrio sp. ZSDZ35]|uniref:Outer membrane protein (Porin) n=1 Tax=Enterovibrio qingdaonensis TaxID=2899818 RepID=A0ABT5QJ28_9GAMM|nr:hypothetical protein [Enterovibrio sp. ZSDZ35]MDD1780301.1 hypothetical protein [Enterovibrio sp. ZSDZ35]
MKKHNYPMAIALLISPYAMAEIPVYDKDGYSFGVDGWVILNASSTRGDAEGNDAFRITSGDSPNMVGFNFGVPESQGIKANARLGLRINPHSGEGNYKNLGNVGSTASKSLDPREIYATFDGDFGQIVIGKQYSIFNGRPVLADASVLAGGFFVYDIANDGGALGAGSLHSGYLYANFNSGIRYNSPTDSSVKFSVGLYDPSTIQSILPSVKSAPVASKTTSPRFEADVSYGQDFDGGNFLLYADTIYQSAENCTVNGVTCASGSKVEATGYSAGASLNYGIFSLFASGFKGEGLGSALQLDFDSLDDSGRERESSGYWLQTTVNVTTDTLLRLSYGETKIDQTDATAGHKAQGTVFGIYHNYNDHIALYTEVGRSEFDLNPVFGQATETDYITVGTRLMW